MANRLRRVLPKVATVTGPQRAALNSLLKSLTLSANIISLFPHPNAVRSCPLGSIQSYPACNAGTHQRFFLCKEALPTGREECHSALVCADGVADEIVDFELDSCRVHKLKLGCGLWLGRSSGHDGGALT